MYKKVLTERQLKLRAIRYKGGPGSGRYPAGSGAGPQNGGSERRGGLVAIGTLTKPTGAKILMNVDGEKMRAYIGKVQEMKDVADMIGQAAMDTDATSSIMRLQSALTKLDSERSALHSDLVGDTVRRIVSENPSLNEFQVSDLVRQAASNMAEKIISHTSKSMSKNKGGLKNGTKS